MKAAENADHPGPHHNGEGVKILRTDPRSDHAVAIWRFFSDEREF